MAGVQIMTGMWINLNTMMLGVAILSVVAAVAVDIKLYWEFLTMRTTKHGMNMGMMIVLVVTLLVCVNYLANKRNKTWDLTTEKMHSLSEQTTTLLKALKDDVEIKVFFRGPQAMEDRQRAKQGLQLYQDYSSKVKVRYINSYLEQQLAIEYLSQLQDRENPVIVFLEHKGKRIRVEDSYDESAFTAALIKATREGATKVYFVQGHGEKDPVSSEDPGLLEFGKALTESSFQVEKLNLIDAKDVPADAGAVAIVGPSLPYLENELLALRAYLKRGGRLFLALDPGQRHNLANLTKTMGVQFVNNYVLTQLQIVGQGPATVLARNFDPGSDITKSFPSGTRYAVFPLVSEVKPAPDKPASIEVKEIVKSDERSFTMTELKAPTEQPKTSMVTMGVEVKGAPEAKADLEWRAVVFGDSDFLTNRGLFLGVNRDLAVNSLAHLTNQKDLVSIRPKLPQGTMMVLTNYNRLGIIVTLMALPLLLLVTSIVLWFRRRGA